MTKHETAGVILSRYAHTLAPTEEDRAAASEAARAMSQAAWEKITPEQLAKRARHARKVGKLGGRPRDAKRCYCGARNWHSATIRRFDCCKRAGKYPKGVPMPPVPAKS